jgi:hypothetical protein
VIALKPHPDLPSSRTIGDSLELRKRKTREKNTVSSTIYVVSILLSLSGTGTRFTHNVSSTIANLLDKPIDPLEMRGYADFPIGVVCSIEERWFAGTTLYVAFMDHGPIKVE